jgi:hypothetical protein
MGSAAVQATPPIAKDKAMRFLTIFVLAWLPGALAVFILQIAALPMVTLGLAFLRAAIWPVWIATGHPHGSPLPMD